MHVLLFIVNPPRLSMLFRQQTLTEKTHFATTVLIFVEVRVLLESFCPDTLVPQLLSN